MATLTVAACSVAGLDPTFVAAAGGGDKFPNDGFTVLEVKNASGGAITVTVASQAGVADAYGTQKKDAAVSVAATTGHKRIGPFRPAEWNDADGNVNVTYSGVTSLTVVPVRVRPS